MSTPPGRDENEHPERLDRVLTTRAIVVAGLVVVVLSVSTLWLLLVLFGTGTPADQARLDVFRATGNVVLGAGGAVALLLAARRQRLGELDLRRKEAELAQREHAQDHVERVAADNRAHQLRLGDDAAVDAVERRITELYTKAADQLGSEKAPIRLAGLYALERLAQNTPGQRQTIVNLLCAYLRLPYTLPDGKAGDPANHQELEVRGTAQRILADHLFPGDDPGVERPEYWPGITLNLTGALLYNLDFRGCRTGNARFGGARFVGWTRFQDVSFGGYSIFGGATFDRSANFTRTRFHGAALFRGARFRNGAMFDGARFTGDALFGGVRTIDGVASPDGAVFGGLVSFAGATFERGVVLEHAQVTSDTADHVWPASWKLSAEGSPRTVVADP
ncbi:pentapeptide repeat-containing protein [Amycolatopsis sp. NPDC049252]|uniref:pentapeptide repeat-containing protein n=1 Tax=Amycolatopsis sp. NPDC049252 TaxID=3363933 RepID=UPI00371AF25F